MTKRKSRDFTSRHSITVMESAAGTFWSQIHNYEQGDDFIWEQKNNSDTRTEALHAAENELDSMTEKWLDEGDQEPEDDGTPESIQSQHQSRGLSSGGR